MYSTPPFCSHFAIPELFCLKHATCSNHYEPEIGFYLLFNISRLSKDCLCVPVKLQNISKTNRDMKKLLSARAIGIKKSRSGEIKFVKL